MIKIVWPWPIFGLLFLGMCMSTTVLIAAKKNGGADKVSDSAYEDGLRYDEVHASLGFAKELESELGISPVQVANGFDLVLDLEIRKNTTVGNYPKTVELFAYRPSNNALDRNLHCQNTPAIPSRYTCSPSLPQAGLWNIELRFQHSGKAALIKRELFLNALSAPEALSTRSALDTEDR